MKKKLLLIIFLLFVLPSVLAINLNIEKQSSNETMVQGIEMPTAIEFKITNLGNTGYFEIYNLVGMGISPDKIFLLQGETKKVILRIFPIKKIDTGYYTFKYTLRDQDQSELDQKITLKIIGLREAFEIGANEFDPETNSLKVYIKNNANFDFSNISAVFSSPFFEFKEDFPLQPYKEKTFEIQLNKEDFKKLKAGFYTINAQIKVNGETSNIEGTLKFIEKEIITTTEDSSGMIINTKVIEKINEGNSIVKSETILKKNLISRLFTSFNIPPNIIERQGFTIYYTWNKEINPGDSLKIVAKTNWLFPLLIIFFICSIVILTKKYSKTDLSMNKRISFVNAKGGEFALKVSIIIHARKYIEKINIIDKLPSLVKIHERFGGEQPKRINEKTKRIEWEFEKLEEGEKRIISYVIYSKIGVLGKFALPSAIAIYEKDGKVHEVQSNKAFFIAEQKRKNIEN